MAGPAPDDVRRVLAEHRFDEDDLRAVANELGLWFSRKPPYEPVYVVPQLEVDGDGVVFAGRLASELREFTYLGRAYAETWAAGAVANPHLGLNDALALLRRR